MKLTKQDYEIIKNDKTPYAYDTIKKWGPGIGIILIPLILYREIKRPTNKVWEKFSKNNPLVYPK